MNTDNEQQQNDAAERRALRDWVSFADLREMGIVPNWQTLRAWQKNSNIAFPLGRLFGPNTRRWNVQTEIKPWLASRPTEWLPRSTGSHRARKAKC